MLASRVRRSWWRRYQPFAYRLSSIVFIKGLYYLTVSATPDNWTRPSMGTLISAKSFQCLWCCVLFNHFFGFFNSFSHGKISKHWYWFSSWFKCWVFILNIPWTSNLKTPRCNSVGVFGDCTPSTPIKAIAYLSAIRFRSPTCLIPI
jgi:hypothetical protein